MANTSAVGGAKDSVNNPPVQGGKSNTLKKPPIGSASWSYTDNEPDTKYDHAWSIARFSRKMEMDNGEELKSGVFSIRTKDRQTDWFLRINPNGEEKSCKGFVSLFLYKDGCCEVPIDADIIFNIIDKDGNRTRAKRCEYTFDKDLQSDNRGFAKFVSHSELRHPHLNLLPNDTLTLLCEISITGDNIVLSGSNKPIHNGYKVQALEPANRLSQDICNIWETGRFSDCTIICEGKEFKCHKNILSARSTVFEAMFSHSSMLEAQSSIVNIEDLDADVVQDMIKYIYSGRTTSLSTKADRLLSAAEKYDLRELKGMCETSLCDTIHTENVLDLLVLADLHQANNLRNLALKVIVESGKEIVSQAGWREKLKAYPEIMADMFEAMTRVPSKRQRFS
eukprot:TRINITY_DN8858_c0_g1_i1.p1 TRINITY_DN8858_c0_g1~~TRINITY_DN8858_c0_g1_i1.p1  ORF type:complete len:394 (+),score=91.00 TRINITY_DN8858_c0_g1_i1:45-1226(+)